MGKLLSGTQLDTDIGRRKGNHGDNDELAVSSRELAVEHVVALPSLGNDAAGNGANKQRVGVLGRRRKEMEPVALSGCRVTARANTDRTALTTSDLT